MSLTVADNIASVLRRHGVQRVFGQGIPSGLVLAEERYGVHVTLYRTEIAGGAMADGYSRISQRVGVVVTQGGPGATLLVSPLAEAFRASTPLLALVQDLPRSNRDRNAFQDFDYEALFDSCTKWICRLDNPARIETDIALALVCATSARPGPVVLLIPMDVLALPAIEQHERGTGLASYPLDRPRPGRDEIEQAAELLASAQRPLVIAGGGVHGSSASEELAVLQEFASLPVATTMMGKGAVAEGHELSVGVIGSHLGINSNSRNLRQVVADADVVFLVGTSTNENEADAWHLLPEAATYLQLDIDVGEVDRGHDSVRLVGDVRAGLEDLVDRLQTSDLSFRRQRRTDVVRLIADGRHLDQRDTEAVAATGCMPIRTERVMSELNKLLGPEDIVVADTRCATIRAAEYLESRRAGQRFLSPSGLTGPGLGLPMALGAKVARPDQTVVCLTGEDGFARAWQEIETAVRQSLPVTIVLLNNGIFAFEKDQELHGFGRYTSASNFVPVDYAAIARAYGATGLRVVEPTYLHDALAEALTNDIPTVVEVMTDSDDCPLIADSDHSQTLPFLVQNASHDG